MPARTVLVFLEVERELRNTRLVQGFIEGVQAHPRGEVVEIQGGADLRRWERIAPIIEETCAEKMRRGETAAYIYLARNQGRADYAEISAFRDARLSNECSKYLIKPMAKARLHGVDRKLHLLYIPQDLEARPWSKALVSLAKAVNYKIAPVAIWPWFKDNPKHNTPLSADPEGLYSFGLSLGKAVGNFVNRWA